MEGASKHRKCGECAYWKTPHCPYLEDAKKGVLRSTDDACGEFYPLPRRKKERKKIVPRKVSGLSDEGYYEAIYDGVHPAFLVKGESGFHVVEAVNIDGKQHKPREVKHYPYKPYGFFEEAVSSKQELFLKVRKEFEAFLDVENIWKDVCSVFVLLSYQQEKLVTVPYPYFVGDNESGKTTGLNILNELCYRPLFGVTIPAADVYGYLEDADAIPTILEDEIQGINRDRDKIKIYKSGYKQGAKVPRTIMLEHDRIIKYYNTFSAKACASERDPTVKGFAERCIFIRMVEGYPEKEWADLTREDLKRFSELRNMLLKWRLETRDRPLPELVLPFKGRVKELWKPLLQVAHGIPVYDILFRFVDNQIKERLDRKQSTLEGHIVKGVVELYDGNPLPFFRVWEWLLDDLKGKVDPNKFHKMFTADFDVVTKQKVGFRLREVLSGERKVIRLPDGLTKAWTFHKDKLRRIAKKYGYEFTPKFPASAVTAVTAVTDSGRVPAPKTMESVVKSNVENGEKTRAHPSAVGNNGYTVTEPILFSVKNWCVTNRNERSEVSLIDLTEFIAKELNQNPQHVIAAAFKQAILMPGNKPGRAVVV